MVQRLTDSFSPRDSWVDPMGLRLSGLPKFLILEPGKGVRLEVELAGAACEIDVELDRPRPGRSFVVMVGHVGGPIVQRVRLAGHAKLFFAPEKSGDYVLILSNPMEDAAVIRITARDVPNRVRARIARSTSRSRRMPHRPGPRTGRRRSKATHPRAKPPERTAQPGGRST
ncbi:MAG: hypothetical protein L3J96_00875 [Thermoplasmata archaeon]|nr:hypothetical protein [Thermoplasmata archaeon]